MDQRKINNLIARHLSGETSPEEQNEFREWLNARESNQQEFRKLAITFQLSKSAYQSAGKKRVFNKIKSKISEESLHYSLNERNKPRVNWPWVSVAASIILLIVSGFFFFNDNLLQGSEGELSSAIMLKTNPPGQKSKVFLPDGSIVWLNSASSIRYEREFNDSVRLIRLAGEAYFDVKKDARRPFIVQSGEIYTTALGTAFNVRAYDMHQITVALTHGKVNVSLPSQNSALEIDPGEGVDFTEGEQMSFRKITIDPEKVKMWKDGLLELDNASLEQTIKKLERWYGVEIVMVNTPTRPWNAKGLFDNEYLENVLNSLSFSHDFSYQIDGKNIYLTFKNSVPM